MPYKRYVQRGRLALLGYGPDKGKVALITDLLDQNKVQIDNPVQNVKRQVVSIKWLVLTDFCVPVEKVPNSAEAEELIKSNGLVDKFYASNWGKKVQAFQRRDQLTLEERREARRLLSQRRQAIQKLTLKYRR